MCNKISIYVVYHWIVTSSLPLTISIKMVWEQAKSKDFSIVFDHYMYMYMYVGVIAAVLQYSSFAVHNLQKSLGIRKEEKIKENNRKEMHGYEF